MGRTWLRRPGIVVLKFCCAACIVGQQSSEGEEPRGEGTRFILLLPPGGGGSRFSLLSLGVDRTDGLNLVEPEGRKEGRKGGSQGREEKPETCRPEIRFFLFVPS